MTAGSGTATVVRSKSRTGVIAHEALATHGVALEIRRDSKLCIGESTRNRLRQKESLELEEKTT